MRSRKLVTVVSRLGIFFAVAVSVPALAQPASSGNVPYPIACTNVAPAESDRAHTLYQAGKAYYDDAEYTAAIVQFREAYRKDCTKHDLLIIISRAYELKADRPAAIDALEEYLRRVPNSPDAQQHKTRIENLRKQIAAQPPPAPTGSVVVPPPITPPPGEVREHTVPPWLVVGLGGAGAVAGIVVLATAPRLPGSCSAGTQTCTRLTDEPQADFDDRQKRAGASQTQPTVGAVILGVGGALVVGGLLWHFLEPTGPVEKTGKVKPKVEPQVGPGFAGLSLGGSF